MKNKILISLFLVSLCSCKYNKINLFLGESFLIQDGNFIEELKGEFNLSFNDEFASSRFYMKSFYNILEQDALNLTTNNSIISLLEKTDKIIFNIGNYELIRLINYNEMNIDYDERVVSTSLEMFDYYLHNSLEVISTYCDDIQIIPLYNSLFLEEGAKQTYNHLINQYNEVIFNNCKEFNIKYVEIDKLSYFIYKDNHLSYKGLTYLLKQIRGGYESN